jgi:hypothetical protein
MTRTLRMATAVAMGLVAVSAHAAPSDGTPKLVSAYAQQMVLMCPLAKGAAPVAPDRADLNGDGLLDWVFDSSRQTCAATSSMAKTYGSLVTVFLATPQGDAQPAFQRAGFGAHMERVAGKARLIVTVAGSDCGEAKPEARCDRAVTWTATTKRLELAPISTQKAQAGAPRGTPPL